MTTGLFDSIHSGVAACFSECIQNRTMRASLSFMQNAIALVLFALLSAGVGNGYSVLTHEEVVDLLWKDQIRPLLLQRFPDASVEDLKQAHSYAYGGSV